MRTFFILFFLSYNIADHNRFVNNVVENIDYCTCINKPPFKAKKEYKRYDFVFDGEIYETNKIEIEGVEFYEFNVRVHTDFKASLVGSDIKIISPVESDMCGVRPETGIIHTFFLSHYGKFIVDSIPELSQRLYIDQCSATVLKFDLKINCKLLNYSKSTIRTYNKY